MRALGFERFAVVGHDRGARVACRLALDHPETIERIAVLDVIPGAEMWATATAASAMKAYHWYMLAQPHPLPETMIAGDPEFYLRWKLRSWAAPGFVFDEESLADYVACFRLPSAIHGSCEDYRAGWGPDRADDEADRGKRRIEAPLLVLWGERNGLRAAKPVETWQRWAEDVRGHEVPGGHFLCEEAPGEVLTALNDFLA